MFFRKYSFIFFAIFSIKVFGMMAEECSIVEPEELLDAMGGELESIEILGEVDSKVYNMTIIIPESSNHESMENFRDEVGEHLLDAGYQKANDLHCVFNIGPSSVASADAVIPYEDLIPNADDNPLQFVQNLDHTYVLTVIVTCESKYSIFYSIEIGRAGNGLFNYSLYFAHGSQDQSIGRQGVKFKGDPDTLISVLHYLLSVQMASSIEIIPFKWMEE